MSSWTQHGDAARSHARRVAAQTAPQMEEREFAELNETLKDAESCARLTNWEEEFLNSLRDRVLQYGARVQISPKQSEVLERIRAKVYA